MKTLDSKMKAVKTDDPASTAKACSKVAETLMRDLVVWINRNEFEPWGWDYWWDTGSGTRYTNLQLLKRFLNDTENNPAVSERN